MEETASPSPPLLDTNRLQITDVYEIATKIGLQFQKAIDQFGSTGVSPIIPMVVNALEQLENVVEENEQLRVEHCRLAMKSDKLREEREIRSRMMVEQEELSNDLETKCRELEQARVLSDSLQQQMQRLADEFADSNQILSNLEVERQKNAALLSTIEDLQSCLDRANEKLATNSSVFAAKDREISHLTADVDMLCKQLEKFDHGNRDLLLSSSLNNTELLNDKIELPTEQEDNDPPTVKEASVTQVEQEEDKQQQVVEETEQQHTATDDDIVTTTDNTTPMFYKKDLMSVLEDRDQLGFQVAELQDEVKTLRMKLDGNNSEGIVRSHSFFSFRPRTPKTQNSSKVHEILQSLTVNLQDAQQTAL